MTGATGYTGTAATASNTGATGYTGYTGTAGTVGFTGYTGYTGYTGDTGTAGTTGYTGSSGGYVIQYGNVAYGSANMGVAVAVTFPTSFSGTPNVQLTTLITAGYVTLPASLIVGTI